MTEIKEPVVYKTTLCIPFRTEREANIVKSSLLVDLKHEGNRMSSKISKSVDNCKNELIIKYESESLKSLRVNINSILDFVILLIDVIENFDQIDDSVTVKTSDICNDGEQ